MAFVDFLWSVQTGTCRNAEDVLRTSVPLKAYVGLDTIYCSVQLGEEFIGDVSGESARACRYYPSSQVLEQHR